MDLDVSYTKGSLSLMVHFSASETVLASRQLVSGGWSFASSQQGSIEATCLAAFALADETPANAGASTQFLLKSQFADGCWPAFEGDSEGSWTTALVLCHLNGMTDFASAREKAYRWLIDERGRESHWLWRWKFKTTDRNVCFDPDKYGWPWVSGSASWVIPTAFSVIAIKQFTVCNRSELSEKRIRLGVDMVADWFWPKHSVSYQRPRSFVAILNATDYSEKVEALLMDGLRLFRLNVAGRRVLLKPIHAARPDHRPSPQIPFVVNFAGIGLTQAPGQACAAVSEPGSRDRQAPLP
jgi:hypothetical protein